MPQKPRNKIIKAVLISVNMPRNVAIIIMTIEKFRSSCMARLPMRQVVKKRTAEIMPLLPTRAAWT